MKIKDGFILRDVAGKKIALPMDDDLDLNMMITLNETGAFLWEMLKEDRTEDALVDALLKEYDVDEPTARKSVGRFLDLLKENGLIDG